MKRPRKLHLKISAMMILGLFLSFALPAYGDISPVGSWTTGLTHTVGAGTDRLLVFVTGYEADEGDTVDVTAVSYGGVPMTQAIEGSIITSGNEARVEIWYLDEAGIQDASGSTFAVTYQPLAPPYAMHAAVTYAGVDQTSPIESTTQNGVSTSNPVEATVSVLSGGMSVAGVTCGKGGTYSWGNGWIEGTDQKAGNTTTMSTAEHLVTANGNDTASADFSASVNRQVVAVAHLKPATGDAGCDDTFAYRKKITIDHTLVSGTSDLVDFPVLVKLTGTDFQEIEDNTRSDGYDIVFRASDGTTPLPHEIEVYDETADELVAWVRVPDLSTTMDTEIYLYYGSGCVMAPTETPNAVWDSNFKGVWHLKEDPSGLGPQIMDSTTNSNHGTAETDGGDSWLSSHRVAGQTGPALYFEDLSGSGRQINVGNDPSLDVTTAITLEAWVKPDLVESANRHVLYKSSGYFLSAMQSHDNHPSLYVFINGDGWRDKHATELLTTEWNHLVGTYDATTRTLRVYINGVEKGNVTLSGLADYTLLPSTDVLTISREFEGVIDEARISDIARSPDWIKTSYDNQASPSTFYSVTPEEVLDPDAPTITITDPTGRSSYDTENGVIDLGGVAGGTWGIVQVTWWNGGTGGSGNCSGTTNWSASISLAEGTNVITVTARDSHDNEVTDLILVEYTPPPEPGPEPDPESNPSPGATGDTEIFSNTLAPNVMILLDTSGSMNEVVWLDAFDPAFDYTTPLLPQGKNVVFVKDKYCYPNQFFVRSTSTNELDIEFLYTNYTDPDDLCSGPTSETSQRAEGDGFFYFDRAAGDFIPVATYDPGNPSHIKIFLPYAEYSHNTTDWKKSTWYNYNYLNWLFYYSYQADRDSLEAQHWVPEQRALLTRILVAKQVIKDLVTANANVRFGIMVFEDGSRAKLLAAIPSSSTAIESNLKDLIPSGGTPLAASLEDVWDYFTGATDEFSLDYWCRRNFVIVLTDGAPTYDAVELSDYMKKDWDGDNGGTEANGWEGDETGMYHGAGSDYLDDVAYYMQHNDSQPDETHFPGIQPVSTYTVGFAFDFGLLNDTATNGGGSYYTSRNHVGLNSALQNIVQEIIDVTYSYTAPVVPVSQMERTTSSDKIYLALFKPTLDAFWKGNIKKFRVATKQGAGTEVGDILDRNGNLAADSSGYIYDTAVSYWGTIEDGGDAEKGGVGQVLLDRIEARNIYTWLNKNERALTDASNAFSTTNASLTAARLGAADDTEKDAVIEFVHGYDAYDQDGDKDTDEKRGWILGDFLHSRPAVVGYNENKVVIFAGANDGMLHAFWDGDPGVHPGGTELWAYIPPVLLPNLKYLAGSSHDYYVDGSPEVYINDADHSGEIGDHADDRVILLCGLRRGGRAYFALDVTDPENPKIPTGWSNYGMWETADVWRPTGMIGAGMSHEAEDEGDASFPYSEMGQSWATPVIGKINDSGTAKNVAFLGGGYCELNQDSDNPKASNEDMGRGIYVVDLATGDPHWTYTWSTDPDVVWSIPSDLTAIDTTDNGYIDRLYVGDMRGRIWRFDISNSSTTNWTGKILFDSNSPHAGGRKIFYRPDVTIEDGYELLYFGTGDRAHPNDGSVVDRIYAVKDNNPALPLDEDDLVDVTSDCLQDPDCTEDKNALRSSIINGNGWYVQLSDHSGEKVLAAPLVFAGAAYFTTFAPLDTEDPCIYQEGTARLYALDYRTGESVLNYDTATAGLTVSDRSMVIGSAIPSRVVVALINGQPEAYIGIRGGIVNPDIGASNPLIRVYWRSVL